jgi:hypothetical protein
LALVLENPLKLFCFVGNASGALSDGTAHVEPGLYASDLLVKLLAATRALDWEVIGVLLEQAISPSQTLIQEVSRHQGGRQMSDTEFAEWAERITPAARAIALRMLGLSGPVEILEASTQRRVIVLAE